jgi:hypothetical protein
MYLQYYITILYYLHNNKHIYVNNANVFRFIVEKCDNTLTVENKKRRVMIDELVTRKYDSDPVKAWKKDQDKDFVSYS